VRAVWIILVVWAALSLLAAATLATLSVVGRRRAAKRRTQE
jgi:hypothetical protein